LAAALTISTLDLNFHTSSPDIKSARRARKIMSFFIGDQQLLVILNESVRAPCHELSFSLTEQEKVAKERCVQERCVRLDHDDNQNKAAGCGLTFTTFLRASNQKFS